MITADQNGTVVITTGAPEMTVMRRSCKGSEMTALEHIQDATFRAAIKDGAPLPLLAYAYRSISGVNGDGKSRVAFWNYKANETLAEIDVDSEINELLYVPSLNQVLCATYAGRIYKIERNVVHGRGPAAPSQEYQLVAHDPTPMGVQTEGWMLLKQYEMGTCLLLLWILTFNYCRTSLGALPVQVLHWIFIHLFILSRQWVFSRDSSLGTWLAQGA